MPSFSNQDSGRNFWDQRLQQSGDAAIISSACWQGGLPHPPSNNPHIFNSTCTGQEQITLTSQTCTNDEHIMMQFAGFIEVLYLAVHYAGKIGEML
jgi:hypothetical protein